MKVNELIVSAHSFLKGIREQHLRSLSELAMRTDLSEGEWILREGEPADRFYLIEEGSVILASHLPTHSHLVIQTLWAGDAVGWSCLFEPYRWHLDARADEATRALCFHGARPREQCQKDPELGYELMERISHVLIQRFQATRLKLLHAYVAADIEM